MEHHLTYSKSYRYEILPCNGDSKNVLYVLHGYGQLSRFFIRKFSALQERYTIVAPEGMHRFYLEGSSGRVGASWMTKEDRLTDIDDTMSFLNEVDQVISQKLDVDRRVLLGFSQGGAAAARWDQLGEVNFDELILWACVFPPDLKWEGHVKESRGNTFVLGSEDPYFSGEKGEEIKNFYRSLGFSVEGFEGGHDIINETLTSILH